METTAFGYEVVAPNRSLGECVATVQWADCWCSDAAQFVLVQASDDLTALTGRDLIHAFGDSHLRFKLQLVCKARILEDDQLLTILRSNGIGILLQTDDRGEIESMATKGILGVRVDDTTAGASARIRSCSPDGEKLVRTAHDFGLRSIASQVPNSEVAGDLLALGFDYVSLRDGGFVPAEPSFAWQRKVV